MIYIIINILYACYVCRNKLDSPMYMCVCSVRFLTINITEQWRHIFVVILLMRK